MEGIYWFRISAVVALIAGSAWFLLPTFLQDSAEDRLADSASGVSAPGKRGVSLEMEFPVAPGADPTALATALEGRLKAAAVPLQSVSGDGASVEVKLMPGAQKSRVSELAAMPGVSALYGAESFLAAPTPMPPPATPLEGPLGGLLATLPADQLGFWTSALPPLGGMAVPAGAVALDLRVTGASAVEGGAQLTLGAAFPVDRPLAVLAVDGVVSGVVGPDARLYTLGGSADTLALLASGPMPTGLLPAVAETAEPEAAAVDEKPVETSSIPPWLAGILPSSKINLGLDLQGGISLTLQVELEEAVLGQVQRDLAYVKEGAQKEGIVVDQVHRTYGLPQMEITTAAPLADLQAYLRQRMPEYGYVHSEGTTHTFELSETRREQVQDQAVEQVLETLRKRVDATGVKEPSIVRKGGGRIEVQLPGLEDVQSAVDAIGTTAVLEFRRVDEEFDDAYLEKMLLAAKEALPPEQFEDDELLNVWLWDQGRLSQDRILLWRHDVGPDGKDQRVESLPLYNEVRLTGNDVNDAGVGWDQNQMPYVTLEFKPRGGQIFCELTEEAVGKRFAVVLDNRIQSAPNIKERICGGSARIEMGGADDPMKESQTLALVLRTGALDAPVVVASVSQVGATLGADAIQQGGIAAAVGSGLVAVFMILWYKTSGVIADIALAVNILMILAALAVLGATLTLPGIAGIALTAGMAVDSNIIVYERIREELRLGVQARKAVDAGFEKALVAILDANITTAIAGIVMFSYGSGPLKGFAVTLLVGIATTLVTAVFVTRTIMEVITRNSSSRLRI